MGIRSKISARKAHYKKLGKDGVRFLNERGSKKEGEMIEINVLDYLNKFHLRNKTSDIPTFYQCIYNEEYNIDIDFTPKVIFDLGANIGLTTVFFKKQFPDAKIISVEPEDSNYNLLEKNTKNLCDISLYKAGIWNKSTNLLIEDNGLGHYGYTVKESKEETKESIPALGIHDIMVKENVESIDILKIDIEGSEKELFEENFESWLPKVKILIVELHDRMKPNCAKTFFKAMSDHDFTFTMKGENIVCYFNKPS
jgi:FkbM family methyltransferase